MIEYQSKSQEELPGTKPAIAVVGIGGAGANVLDRIALEGLTDAELISMNSDVRALANSVAPTKIQLGKMLTQGLGAGGDPDLGREAAQASMEEIRESLKGKDLVFLCSGQGGGIGSGAAPMVAQAAKEQGAFVVVFATMPFCFEGKRRLTQARESLELYRGCADALITFDNDRMGELILPKEGIQQAFAAADQIISQSIRAVTALVTQPGLIHIGMDDLIAALRNNDSRCLFGHGSAKGQNRAQEALKRALKSPLLDKGKLLEKSKNLLVHISGGESMTLYEVELLMNALEKHVPESTQILFGASSDKSLGDSLSVTLISSLTSVEMSGGEGIEAPAATEAVRDPSQQFQPQGQQPSVHSGQVPAPASAMSLASGESIIRASAPVGEQQPVAGVKPQPEVVEPPYSSPPPISSPPVTQQPQAQPVVYAQQGVQGGQPSTTSGLGKSSESVQSATPAVESARGPVETASEEVTEEEVEAPVAEAAAEVTEEVSTSEETNASDEVVETGRVGESADKEIPVESESDDEETVVEIVVPKQSETEDEVEAESEDEVEAESEDEVEAESEDEVEAESEDGVEAETEDEVEAETEDEVEAETEDEVEAETEDEVEAETEDEVEAEAEDEVEAEAEDEVESESEDEVEAESEDEVEAESEDEVEAESEDEVEAEAEDEVEAEAEDEVEAQEDEEPEASDQSPVVVKPARPPLPQRPMVVQAKETPRQTVVLKPVAKQQLAPVAKVSESDETKPVEVKVERPRPAVDMATALAEVEKNRQATDSNSDAEGGSEAADLERMGTMGPAAALGLKSAPEASGPSMESANRPTVTARDPRTGKQQMLELEPVAKGRFDKAEPTVVDGEDLDIPTFLRKKGNYT